MIAFAVHGNFKENAGRKREWRVGEFKRTGTNSGVYDFSFVIFYFPTIADPFGTIIFWFLSTMTALISLQLGSMQSN